MARTHTTQSSDDGIVIAGGGLAGQRCAETLRRGGYPRPIRVVCAEPQPPYDRPPLSKELLTDPGLDADWGSGRRTGTSSTRSTCCWA